MIGKTVRAACIAFALVPPAASAATIDFDGLATNILFSNGDTFTEDGFTFEVSFTGGSKVSGVSFFDTTCTGSACNGDTDLKPNGGQGTNGISGNVMILQENSSPIPDDAAASGSVSLKLLSGSAFSWIGASAVDDTVFTFSTAADGVLGTIDLPADKDTGMVTFASSIIRVGDSITISYGGSGGVDALQLAAVPVPAAGLMLLTALGGLGVAQRRRARRKA